MSLPAPAPIYYSRRLVAYLKDLWRRREFAWFLAKGNIRAANASTVLGAVWWVLNPLLLASIYFLVFGVIFAGGRRGDPGYLAYLLSGMFPFHFTSRAFSGGANTLLSNSKLLVNVKFPRLILPISGIMEGFVGFLASLAVFYIVIVPLSGAWAGADTFMLFLIVPLHLLFSLGLSTIGARLAVPFRDIGNLIPYVNRLWLYLSPIIWFAGDIDGLPEWVQTIIRINPMYSILGVYRLALTGEPMPEGALLMAVVWSLGLGAFGIASFIRFESRMVRYL